MAIGVEEEKKKKEALSSRVFANLLECMFGFSKELVSVAGFYHQPSRFVLATYFQKKKHSKCNEIYCKF